MTETCLPEDRIPVIRISVSSANANPDGSIFGGWIMSRLMRIVGQELYPECNA